jgi:outer membrane protein OmpA-like peptidoglycan-associated protein
MGAIGCALALLADGGGGVECLAAQASGQPAFPPPLRWDDPPLAAPPAPRFDWPALPIPLAEQAATLGLPTIVRPADADPERARHAAPPLAATSPLGPPTLAARLLFKPHMLALAEEEHTTLATLAERLRSKGGWDLRIEAYARQSDPRSLSETQRLAVARARLIRDNLAAQGLDPKQILILPHASPVGADDPWADRADCILREAVGHSTVVAR